MQVLSLRSLSLTTDGAQPTREVLFRLNARWEKEKEDAREKEKVNHANATR